MLWVLDGGREEWDVKVKISQFGPDGSDGRSLVLFRVQPLLVKLGRLTYDSLEQKSHQVEGKFGDTKLNMVVTDFSGSSTIRQTFTVQFVADISIADLVKYGSNEVADNG
jgi:hypothetical protein